MLRGTAREAAAEFVGTAVLIAFGSAVVAQVVLSGQSHGGYLSINIAWGLAVTGPTQSATIMGLRRGVVDCGSPSGPSSGTIRGHSPVRLDSSAFGHSIFNGPDAEPTVVHWREHVEARSSWVPAKDNSLGGYSRLRARPGRPRRCPDPTRRDKIPTVREEPSTGLPFPRVRLAQTLRRRRRRTMLPLR
jgi:hypothetical protein